MISAGNTNAALTIGPEAVEAAGRAVSALGALTIHSTLPVLLEAQTAELQTALNQRDAQLEVLFSLVGEQRRQIAKLESYIDREFTRRDVRMDAHLDMIGLQRKALASVAGRLDLFEKNEKAALERLELIDHTVRGMIDNAADDNEEQARRISHLGRLVAELREEFDAGNQVIFSKLAGHSEQHRATHKLVGAMDDDLSDRLTRVEQGAEALSSVAAHSARVVNLLAQQLDEAKGHIKDLAVVFAEGAQRHMGLTDLVRSLHGKLAADYEFVCERLAEHAKQLAELEAVEDRQDEAITEVESRVDDLVDTSAPVGSRIQPNLNQWTNFSGGIPLAPQGSIRLDSSYQIEGVIEPSEQSGTIRWDSTWTIEESPVLITAEPSPNVRYWSPSGVAYTIEEPPSDSGATVTLSFSGVDVAEPGSDMTVWTAAELADERVAHYTLGYYKGRDPRVQVVDCCDHPGLCCKCQGAPSCAYLDSVVQIVFEGDGETRTLYGYRKPDGSIEFPGF